MSPAIRIEAQSGQGRAGRILTPHGEVETPVFVPVGTAASVKGVPQHVLEEMGVELLLANTYHLYLRPGIESLRRLGGLHRFMGWERSLLTDSGGFQVFSLSGLRKVSEEGVSFRSHLNGSSHFLTPEKAVAAQIALGADMAMAFDECTEYPAEPDRCRASMELTLRWAARSKRYFDEHCHEVPWGRAETAPGLKPGLQSLADAGRPEGLVMAEAMTHTGGGGARQALFGIVQGGVDGELRRQSAERTMEMGFDGYAIGGLSVGEPRELTREIIAETVPLLPSDKPRYVMGVGYPEEIAMYAALGVDMMDCVLPTRAARHGLLFTSEGRLNIKNARFAEAEEPADSGCACLVCRRYSRAYLRHLYVCGEPLAAVLNSIHNLAHYLDTVKSVRHSIKIGETAKLYSGLRSVAGSDSQKQDTQGPRSPQ